MSGPAVARPLSEAVDPVVFAADVRSSLSASPRQLPSKYFYDELGSSVTEAAQSFVHDVKSRAFPGPQHTFE